MPRNFMNGVMNVGAKKVPRFQDNNPNNNNKYPREGGEEENNEGCGGGESSDLLIWQTVAHYPRSS